MTWHCKDNAYLKLIAILIIPMALICGYGLYDKEFCVGDIILRKAFSESLFLPETSPTANLLQDSITQTDSIVCDTTAQRILFFGDSMLEGLGLRLKQYAAENQHELLNIVWYSSSTKVWAEHIDTLRHFMRTFQPTYMMICLGANELFISHPENQDANIKTILQQIDTIPYVWIGPPNWKEDTGICDLIEQNVGKLRFFPSKRLKYKRISDGAHPTVASAAMWMDSVACWMSDSIQYRISMRVPANKKKMQGNMILLQPLRR